MTAAIPPKKMAAGGSDGRIFFRKEQRRNKRTEQEQVQNERFSTKSAAILLPKKTSKRLIFVHRGASLFKNTKSPQRQSRSPSTSVEGVATLTGFEPVLPP